jgi:hypothetical protein
VYINVRENRKGNQERTTQRHWQQLGIKEQDEDKEKKTTTWKNKKRSNTENRR